MNNTPADTYSHSADYSHVEAALKALWLQFQDLISEIQVFTPKVEADFSASRLEFLGRLKKLNPESDEASLLKIVDGQMKFEINPRAQFYALFGQKIMGLYVTTAIVSHALVESAINTVLAVGLATRGSADLFSLVERADIKEKWTTAPKLLHPAYSLSKGGALYETLQRLTKERNSYTHHKVEVEVQGKKLLEGSKVDRSDLHAKIEWMRRYFSLPFDLVFNIQSQFPNMTTILLYDASPIELFEAHRK